MSVEIFRTAIPVTPFSVKISYSTQILLLGSCFTEHIGEKLKYYKFPVQVNPFGIIYNPLSVEKSLNRLLECKLYDTADLAMLDDIYCSFDHHSRFSGPEYQKCLEMINETLTRGNQVLQNAGFLFITFGTAYYYRLKSTGQVVSNCHKFPETYFTRHKMTVSEIVDAYHPLLENLQAINPQLKIVFTVSPIRHWKDGAHENQLSKSILLLAIDELVHSHENLFYFPAYELMLDELRDYRFYEEDMLHPNKVAIDFIWKRFVDGLIDRNTTDLMKQIEKIQLAGKHRPFQTRNEKFRNFVIQQLTIIENLSNQYPTIDLSSDYQHFRSLIE